MTSTVIDLGRPQSGDVIDLIQADHELFERLLRLLRDVNADREAARWAFAALHVAHAEAEEKLVYPVLRKRDVIGGHEDEHSREEHAEGNEALLAVLELKGTDTQAFDDAVENLSTVVNHHLGEEELSILGPARRDLGERKLRDLGEAFATERNRLIDADCGTLENVRTIVARADRQGLLTEDS